MKFAAIGLIVLIVVIIFVGFFKPNIFKSNESAPISGTIDFNGVAPAGSTISIAERLQGKGEFQVVIFGLAAQDQTVWNWNGAQKGKNYEVRAYLMQGNTQLATSSTIVVSAPATEESLTLNTSVVNPGATPAPSASAAPSPTPGPAATVSGTIDLNGYVPTGSIIQVQTSINNQTYQNAGNPVSAVDGQTWSWQGASAGVTYQVQAILTNGNGVQLGQSLPVVVTAPAQATTLTVNSTAQAPQPTTGTISGTINLNGVTPANSSIVILQAPAGSSNYQVAVNSINPVNGATWSWNGAQIGTSYSIIAALKQNNANGTQTDVADSTALNVTAPAANEVLTLNSNASLPAPSVGNITVNCGTKNNSSNSWPAQVSFPTVSNAQSYWFQIGTTSGGSNLVNTYLNAANAPAQIVNATFNDSVTYYAQYAYSYVSGASWTTNGYSGFSGSTTLICQ